MKRNFVQVTNFLEEQFPELRGKITGGNFPIPPYVEFLTNILTCIQLFGVAWMMLGGDKLLNLIGYTNNNSNNANNNGNTNQLPQFYYIIQNNAVPIGMFIYLLAPQLLGKFQTNGGFEIYLNNKIMFSKLSTGRLPGIDDLVNPLLKAGLQQIPK